MVWGASSVRSCLLGCACRLHSKLSANKERTEAGWCCHQAGPKPIQLVCPWLWIQVAVPDCKIWHQVCEFEYLYIFSITFLIIHADITTYSFDYAARFHLYLFLKHCKPWFWKIVFWMSPLRMEVHGDHPSPKCSLNSVQRRNRWVSFHRAFEEPAAWYRLDAMVKVTVMMRSCKVHDLEFCSFVCLLLFKLPKFV